MKLQQWKENFKCRACGEVNEDLFKIAVIALGAAHCPNCDEVLILDRKTGEYVGCQCTEDDRIAASRRKVCSDALSDDIEHMHIMW